MIKRWNVFNEGCVFKVVDMDFRFVPKLSKVNVSFCLTSLIYYQFCIFFLARLKIPNISRKLNLTSIDMKLSIVWSLLTSSSCRTIVSQIITTSFTYWTRDVNRSSGRFSFQHFRYCKMWFNSYYTIDYLQQFIQLHLLTVSALIIVRQRVIFEMVYNEIMYWMNRQRWAGLFGG